MDEQLTLRLDGAPQRPDAEPLELRFEAGTLVIDGLAKGDEPLPDELTWDDRIERYRGEAIDYRLVLAKLLRVGHTVVDRAREYVECDFTIEERLEPYEHQREALEAWHRAGKRGLVVLPTGAGKTYVAQMAIESVARSTLVVVPTIDLMNQWSGVLEEAFGCKVGLLGGGYHEIEDLTVTTYDSAAIHMERIGGQFGLVVFDEAHHLPGEVYRQAADCSIAPFRLGLTATPERADGKEAMLDELIGPIVYRKSIKELSGDILADYEVRTVPVAMTDDDFQVYSAARKFYRDFVEARGIRMSSRSGWPRFLAATNQSEKGRRALKAYQLQKRLALVHEAKMHKLYELLERHHDDRVLVFTNDNDSVYEISEKALVPAITHQTKIKERKEILARFNEGTYRVVVTSKVLNEGVDVPKAAIAVILSGSGSVREHVQRLGRILRRAEDKRAVLYELVTENSVETYVSERRRKHDAYD
ncbi:DEAD/DEAH box helicase [Persicimonas caeni]|uniref:DEAD/DEAH box helicase n=1 Tax=Persicimonas caeni TaxID=2292766 RepID=A0A4Y6Q2K6_PERCE|nr:DEAD/DEAH box helicase family protein [Persicimonas caeni]QDG54235.1 DEAD/DEAH box helicase [Persicimonas caeni]QED35456.1 DEAD/DEAH box helicase [Persicimonas caeni]